MSESRGTRKLKLIVKIYAILGPYLKPYWARSLLAGAGMLGVVLIALLEPWPLKIIFDQILLRKPAHHKLAYFLSLLGNDRSALLIVCCLALVAMALLDSVCSYISRYYMVAVGQGVTNDVRLAIFDHLQALSLSSLGPRRTGDVVVRMTSDIKAVRDLLVSHLQKFGSYSLTVLSTAAVMIWMNWRLSLLAFAVAPVLYIAGYRFSLKIRTASRRKQRKEGEVASIVQETITSMAVVQAFTQEKGEKKRFTTESQERLQAALESARLGRIFNQVVKVLSACGLAIVVWRGTARVLGGALTPGDLIVFVAYVKSLYTPIGNLSELIVEFMDSLVSGERVIELFEAQSDVKDAPDAVKAPPFAGEVSFEGVTAGYGAGEPVLKDLTFQVRPGQIVALVGSSGAGKSTFVNLMLRFIDPRDGCIRIDGQDIRRFTLKSLRKQISVVPQKPILFRRTIRENIAYGRPKATLEEIVSAAKAAQAHGFILRLPEQYDTLLEERGDNLSGGQKQRLAMARALLRNNSILILDEPATGLDAITESQMYEALRTLVRSKTIFIIAHRLSTVENADLILMLEEGGAVEQGTHAELLAKNTTYRRFYETQGGLFRPESEQCKTQSLCL